MPSINALTGKVRLLKADEKILDSAIALVDCLVEQYEHVFAEDERLTQALETAREPLAVIRSAVHARIAPARAVASDPPKIAEAG